MNIKLIVHAILLVLTSILWLVRFFQK